MSEELYQKCSELVQRLNLGTADSITAVTPLTGGVSSDIACVELGPLRLCAKFALPKLKVAANWHAPVHRNRAEYAWLKIAASIAPESAVKLYGRSEALQGFVMEYLDENTVYLWKTALLTEQEDHAEAGHLGNLTGLIHAASTKPAFDTDPFQNRDDFYALRIEPYLVYTASQHPALGKSLSSLANNLYRSNQVLVHGDISPKNILFRDSTPIILDAECATMGDASFDLAFCLNHLILKAVHLPSSRTQLLHSVLTFWQAYRAHISWEPAHELEARVCRLLPALMLARVDGKSPVEYLYKQNQSHVRSIATELIEIPRDALQDVCTVIAASLTLKEASID